MGESRDTFDMLRLRAVDHPGAHLSRTELVDDGRTSGWVLEADGTPAFYVEVPAETDFHEELNAKGFAVEVRAYAGFESQRALMIRLRNREMEAAFASMIDDLVDTAKSDLTATTAIVARKTVDRWREMFKAAGRDLLSLNEQVGLLAELHLLAALADAGATDPLEAWHRGGPSSQHDFSFETGDVEVKATTARESFDITVHGLEQLSTDDGRALILYAEQLEARADGETLPEAISALERRGFSRLRIREKLEACGYFEAHAPSYTDRFAVLRCKAREVDDTMPRISKSYLPDEAHAEDLKRVSYSIDFGPIDGFEGPEASLLATSLATP